MKIFISNLGMFLFLLIAISCKSSEKKPTDTDPRRLEILFLGHASEHHNSGAYAPILSSALSKDGINISYTENTKDLNEDNLSLYDGLIIYANHDSISQKEEEALLDFVSSGHAFIPIHSASFCFRNSPEYVDMVGGQFKSHETGTFTAKIVDKEHPISKNIDEFSTWDETYVHYKLSDDRKVLQQRIEGAHEEPWTWVKDYGKGKVFYTAYGHDERTWEQPEFQNLIKQGILWAVDDQVINLWEDYKKSIPELVYKDMPNIPNYEKRDPAPKYQEPLSPEESKKLIQVPAGFSLELFASEPDIVNPIAMNWDEKGRLWVVETVDYPNTVRNDKGKGDDRIKICEDTNGDGKADKFTVFAENLNIPTSFTFANGGIIISQAPNFLFLKDTNGDDKADVREVMIDGWGTFDTHAGPSNLQRGMDNKIYGVVGYSGFDGTIADKDYKFRQAVYRFSPDLSNFEVLTNTSNNTWGLGFREDNSLFASTANNTHSVFVGIPNRYFEGVKGIPSTGSKKIDGHYAMHPNTSYVRQVDVFGGFTAASGHHFYTARNYPSSYWDQVAFVCEPTGHLVHKANIANDGAGFSEHDGWNLFASSDEWVSPVAANVGPDGAVWILDWYNFIIQHNPTPTDRRGGYDAETGEGNAYENPLRDKSRGRVWRVVWKGASKNDTKTLSKEDPDNLVKALSDDNMFWRTTAQRLLVERNKTDVVPQLQKLIKDEDLDSLGYNPGALHSLWTLDGLGAIVLENQSKTVLMEALEHPSYAVRKAAVQILSKNDIDVKDSVKEDLLNDPNPKVQLAAVLYLVDREPSDKTGTLLYELGDNEKISNDPWLSKAIYVASSNNSQGFLTAFKKDNPNFTESNATPVENPGEDIFEEKSLAEVFAENYDLQEPATTKIAQQSSSAGAPTVINIKTVQNEMEYDITEFNVQAGQPVKIVFENPDFMQHNLVITKPGEKEKVGLAADKLATDPTGAEKQYVPQIPEVLFYSPLLDPEQTVTIEFTAPDKEGVYPFICTFPGHWRIMQGEMTVVASE